MIGCTTLLMSFKDPSYAYTENAVVDGVIELSRHAGRPAGRPRADGPQVPRRRLPAGQARGRDHRAGGSSSTRGPRSSSTSRRARPRRSASAWRSASPSWTGCSSAACPRARPRPCSGPRRRARPCSGLSFLVEGARQGQQGIYFGFYEPPPRLLEKAAQVGIDARAVRRRGLIELIWQPPLEHMLDSLAEQLLEKIRENPEPRRRLFIDGIEGFRAAACTRTGCRASCRPSATSCGP